MSRRWRGRGVLGQQVANGLMLGSVYALIGIGYTLVFGVLQMLNMAHLWFFMLAPSTALHRRQPADHRGGGAQQHHVCRSLRPTPFKVSAPLPTLVDEQGVA